MLSLADQGHDGLIDLLLIAEEEAYSAGLTVYEVKVQLQLPGWLCLVKALRKGKPVIAFVGAEDYPGTLLEAGRRSKYGLLSFSEDKYPRRDWRAKYAALL